MPASEHVAILGASPKVDRYSHKAQKMLMENGHTVYPVGRHEGPILGVKTYASLAEIEPLVDTVTVYLSPRHLADVIDDLIEVAPKRAIMNPGTEDPELELRLTEAGIHCQHACTLVLLRTGQYIASSLD